MLWSHRTAFPASEADFATALRAHPRAVVGKPLRAYWLDTYIEGTAAVASSIAGDQASLGGCAPINST